MQSVCISLMYFTIYVHYFGDKCFLFMFLAFLKLLDGSNEHDNLYRTFVLNDLCKEKPTDNTCIQNHF